MDTCKIRPGLYQFTAIDDCSRLLVAGLARRRSAQATLTFLDQVLEEMPFPIQRLQTDRGTEFFAESVQRRLMNEAIRFRPIPPRSPHLNGKVERAQRTVLEEFWAVTDPKAADVAWVCQRADKTPLRATVSEAHDPAKEHVQVRHHVVEMALRALK
jgi:transposase InsO family protein